MPKTPINLQSVTPFRAQSKSHPSFREEIHINDINVQMRADLSRSHSARLVTHTKPAAKSLNQATKTLRGANTPQHDVITMTRPEISHTHTHTIQHSRTTGIQSKSVVFVIYHTDWTPFER